MKIVVLTWLILSCVNAVLAQESQQHAREIVIKALEKTPCPTETNPEASCARGLKRGDPLNQTFGKLGLKNREQQNGFAIKLIQLMDKDTSATEIALANILPYIKSDTRLKLIVNYLETTFFPN